MAPPSRKKRACRENGNRPKHFAVEIDEGERFNQIQETNDEQRVTINNIVIAIAFLRSDFAGVNTKVESLQLEKRKLEQKNQEIVKKIMDTESENDLLKKKKQFMTNEDEQRKVLIETQRREIKEAEKTNKILIQQSPTAGRTLFQFNDLKDRKSKNERCMMVIQSIKQIIKSENVDTFLSYFFSFINDSPSFSTRYQLSDEETFYCKVRFHLSDTFFRLFKKYYQSVTGFDVFCSRHDIAKICRRVSVAQYYEVSSQAVPKKSLSGAVSYVKRPLVVIKSLEEVLSSRLSTLAQNSRLLFDRSTGDDISVILSGDKGGDETKLVLILENTDKPNSSKSQLILGFYCGDDDHGSLKKNLSSVFDQFNHLSKISYRDGIDTVTRRVKKKVVGDVKILCSFYNHGGAACLENCFICWISYSNHGTNMAKCGTFPFDVSHGLRTMEEYKRNGIPLVEIAPKFAIIPPLHCFQGITNKYGLDHLSALAKSLDLKKFNFPGNISAQKARLRELDFEEQLYVRKIKTLCEELEKLKDVKAAFEKYEKKSNKSFGGIKCESQFCISSKINKKLFESDSYQCCTCQKKFHFFCNGIVSLSEKTAAPASNKSSYCFECSSTGSVENRKNSVEIKIIDTQRTIDSEESGWGDVYEEKKEVKKIVSGFGKADSFTKKLDEKMKKIGCVNFDCAKNLTGNQARRFLRKTNIDEAMSIFPPSQELEKVRKFLYSLAQLMSYSDSELKTDAQLKEIDAEVKNMVASIREAHPDKNVTVKLHLVSAHLLDFLKMSFSWSKVCEQGVEHLHSDFKRMHLVFAAIMDPLAKGHAFLNALTNENYLYDKGEAWNI